MDAIKTGFWLLAILLAAHLNGSRSESDSFTTLSRAPAASEVGHE